MKNIFFVLVLLFSINTLKAQIYEGKVAEYDDRYDMSEIESYKRIDANGGLAYTRKGFISFKDDGIIFVIGKSNDSNEVYMNLDFQSESYKNLSILSSELFGIIPTFIMQNEEKKQVVIEYFTLLRFLDLGGGQFIISIGQKMYIMHLDEDVIDIISGLYKV